MLRIWGMKYHSRASSRTSCKRLPLHDSQTGILDISFSHLPIIYWKQTIVKNKIIVTTAVSMWQREPSVSALRFAVSLRLTPSSDMGAPTFVMVLNRMKIRNINYSEACEMKNETSTASINEKSLQVRWRRNSQFISCYIQY